MGAISEAAALPQQPATAAEERVGPNDALAAALTRAVGSMPALYVVLVVFAGWMTLATYWPPLHHKDKYPFGFLLFLDNVAQLVLCLVILVGQRVLGAAADRRSVQTYQSANAIFDQIADIQAHLDRHDAALGRGISLLESSAHPWIERHRVRLPPQALDHAVGVNGRIAAWLTGRLSSMWAVYVAAATQLLWTGLYALGVQHFDHFPFPFMSFLSTLAQLIFMIVIMVGQGVLERAGDRRSEQTFLNAEAILHECRRMKARLTAQDRLIESLSGYTNADITERVARALHERDAAGDDPSALLWAQLSQELRDQARERARRIGEQLAVVGCLLVPAFDTTVAHVFSEQEAQALARADYERQLAEQATRESAGEPASVQADAAPASWEQLAAHERRRVTALAHSLPQLLSGVGLQVVRDTRVLQGSGEADFAPEEWAVLQRAPMSAGLLVGLAVGVVDPEEMFVLVKMLRDASTSHPLRLVREVTATATFETGLRADTRYAEFVTPALATVRQAAEILAAKAPADLAGYRQFLVEVATAVADANREGGILGIGAHFRTSEEAAAVEAIRKAAHPAPAA